MAQSIRDVMTPNPMTVPADAELVDVAQLMRTADVGVAIVVRDDGTLCGILTDRDIVVRAVAEGLSPREVTAEQVCTPDLTVLGPESTAQEAASLMRERAVRRLPVVEDGRPIGVVSLGDLAVERDPSSTLADISVAPPQG